MTDEGIEIMLALERRRAVPLTKKETDELLEEFSRERLPYCTICRSEIIPLDGEGKMQAVDRHLKEHPERHREPRRRKGA